MHNSFFDYCECLSDGLDVLVSAVDSLDLYIGDIHINFWWLFGAVLVCAIYNTLLGYSEEGDVETFASNYGSEEDW